MRMDDLPRTVVIDGRRIKRRIRRVEVTHEDAHRDMLAQAQDVYRQALGALVMCTTASSLARVRAIGREFLKSSGAQCWTPPAGVTPANQNYEGKRNDPR